MAPVRIAVAGAGLIGRRHIEEVLASPAAELAAIVDPAPRGRGAGRAGRRPGAPDAERPVRGRRGGRRHPGHPEPAARGRRPGVRAGRRAGDRGEAARGQRAGRHPAGRGRRGCRRAPAHRTPPPAQHDHEQGPGGDLQRGAGADRGGGRQRRLLQAGRLLRRRRRVAQAAGRRADPAQPDPRGERPDVAGRGDRERAGGQLQRHAAASRWRTPPR